jgi:hypothetical protein
MNEETSAVADPEGSEAALSVPEPVQAWDREEALRVWEEGTVDEARAFLKAHRVKLEGEWDEEGIFDLLSEYAEGKVAYTAEEGVDALDAISAAEADKRIAEFGIEEDIDPTTPEARKTIHAIKKLRFQHKDWLDAQVGEELGLTETQVQGLLAQKTQATGAFKAKVGLTGGEVVYDLATRRQAEPEEVAWSEWWKSLTDGERDAWLRDPIEAAAEHIESAISADEEPIAEATEQRRTLVGVMFVPASEIQARQQRWLWDGRIPLALPTLLVGMQGLGKSQLTAWLTARVTQGEIGGHEGTVLVLSAEDDPNTTIVPRLIAAGADLERVRIHRVERSLTFPKDIALLDEAVQMYGATFVVVDPVMAYLDSETDAYKPQDVRRTMRGIHAVCQERHVTVLPLMHFRKESANEVLHMVTSSSAFTEAPRSVLGLGQQPDASDGQLALVHLKCNVGPKQPTLEVTIEPTIIQGADGEIIETSFVKVGGAVDLSARDVFQPKQGRPAETLVEAMNFLKGLLVKYNRRIPVTPAKKEWVASGMGSPKTLQRAREEMGLGVVRDENGAWFWVEEF